MERNQIPHRNVMKHIKATIPSMRYQEGENFQEWQKKGKEKLKELLGLPFVHCEDLFQIEFEKEHESFKEIRFTFQSEEGYFVPCHLVIPNSAKGPVPIVICLQGHSKGMHISLGRTKFPGDEKYILYDDSDFAVGALKRGYCGLTIEQRGFGECGSRKDGTSNCDVSSLANLLIGRTTIGERVWDISCAIDILEKYFDGIYDKNNIICLGNSGGGTATFYAGCLEERIKTAISAGAYTGFDESIAAMLHCTCNFVPHIREYFNMGDLGGLISPRNFIPVSGDEDKYFPVESAREQFAITKRLFQIGGGKCAHVAEHGGHRFYYDATWKVFDELEMDR